MKRDPIPDPPGLVAARQRLADAEAALEAARTEHSAAQRDYAEAEGRLAEGRALAGLALTGNPAAMRHLDEEVRAMHPGIVGYLPVPTANDTPGWFRANMEDLGLRIDFPAEVDADFIAGLAGAMREFVHRYEPKVNHPNARSGQQGYAYAQTRAGMLVYPVRRSRPARLRHLPDWRGDSDVPRPDETYRTLEDALAALSSLVVLAGLDGRVNPHFRNT